MPAAMQVAALPFRRRADGGFDVLMVTSRVTKRWILPKGWPKAGLSAAHMAAVEAWEEAGVRGTIADAPVGSFEYAKRRASGPIEVTVSVYPLAVKTLADTWPESGERKRAWFKPAEAAAIVDEPGLKALLLALEHSEEPAPWPSSQAKTYSTSL